MPGLADLPLHTAEFVAVDTETNGRMGEACEVTEIGAVLVGGGELHDEVESLVRVEQPLSRGIERFTGITQAMVDTAPPPARCCPLAAMLEGRVLVAHNAQFDRRVLRQAFERSGVKLAEPAGAVHGRDGAQVRAAGRAARAGQAGRVAGHRGRGRAPRAGRRAHVRADLLRAVPAAVRGVAGTVGDAARAARPKRGGRASRGDAGRRPVRPPPAGPQEAARRTRASTSSATRAGGRSTSASRSPCATRARAHFCAPAGWTEKAEVVDYQPTNSELGALVLENRLIKKLKPPGNAALEAHERARLHPLPARHPVPGPRGGREPAPGHAVNIGPLRGQALAEELVGQLQSVFGLRQCGRKLTGREHPSAYGQMGRCMSPCLNDLDPNAYRRRLDEALALFDGTDRRASG